MAAAENPYAVLGLVPSADLEAVKRRYRTLARELHPDVNSDAGAADAMAAVNEAYAILTDPERRRRLDRTGRPDVGRGLFDAWFADLDGYDRFLGFYKSQWCHQCGVEIHERGIYSRVMGARRADALYCSNACRQKAYRARKAAQKRLEARNR